MKEANEVVAASTIAGDCRVVRLLELGCRSLGMAVGMVIQLDDVAPPEILVATASEVSIPSWFGPALAAQNSSLVSDAENVDGRGGYPGLTHPLPHFPDTHRVLCFANPLPGASRPQVGGLDFLELLAQWLGLELERQKYLDSLQTLSEWQRVILQSSNFSIIATDLDGLILSFNQAAETMLGYSSNEVIGKQTPKIIHDPTEVIARAAELSEELGMPVEPGFDVFVAKTRQGIVEEREWTYVRKDGSRFSVLLSVTAMRNTAGEIQGYLGIAVDITLRKRFEEASARFVPMS